MRIFELTLPRNQWVSDISTADKHEIGDDLVGLVQAAYTNTTHGSFVNSLKDVIPSDWSVIDFDDDHAVDACVFYRKPRSGESWTGHKIQGIGHDGTAEAKHVAINKVQRLLNKSGWWIESSDAMRAVLMKSHANPVTDVDLLKRLFNDADLTMVDDCTYKRKLPAGPVIIETVFGHPVIK